MSYFSVLAIFLGPPIFLLTLLTWRDMRRGMIYADRAAIVSIGLLVLIAVAYTTPWDNYLVATDVWWYDEALVTGITLGWVPIEEYTFFVVQTVFSGLFLLALLRHVFRASPTFTPRPSIRYAATGLVGLIWVGSIAILVAGWQAGTYLGLELVWALIPVMTQLIFGADILWNRRGFVATSVLVPTLYLCILDFIAIDSGTWTIDPEQSTGILFAGVLPIEEIVFFLLTNVLVVFGVSLLLLPESRQRAHKWLMMMGFDRLARHEHFSSQAAISSEP